MNKQRKVRLSWLQLQRMQQNVCLEKQMDNIIYYSSAKTSIEPPQESKTVTRHRPRNTRIQTQGAILRTILKHEIWNPLIHARYQSPQSIKSSQSTVNNKCRKMKSQTFVDVDCNLSVKKSLQATFENHKRKHSKSLLQIKQELLPFFDDIKTRNKLRPAKIQRKDNLTAMQGEKGCTKSPLLSKVSKNIGAFKIHQIQWRKRPKPTFNTQKLFQINGE